MSNAKMPAFPIAVSEGDYAEFGLTKLEYFAGLAMQGELACAYWSGVFDEEKAKLCAAKCVTYAKALIAELDNQP